MTCIQEEEVQNVWAFSVVFMFTCPHQLNHQTHRSQPQQFSQLWFYPQDTENTPAVAATGKSTESMISGSRDDAQCCITYTLQISHDESTTLKHFSCLYIIKYITTDTLHYQ